MRTANIPNHSTCRRGAVVVLVAVSLVVILGFGALAIDLGQLYLARAELQRAADAAALAGASAYFTDAGLAQDLAVLEPMIHERAQRASLKNPTHHVSTVLESADIVIGTFDPDYPHAALDTSGLDRLNAVQVTVRRTPESTNGSISLYLAGVLGIREASVVATATAMANDQLGGLQVEEEEEELQPPLIPVTVNVDLYHYMAANSRDKFSYVDKKVLAEPDGVREMNLYTWRLNLMDLDDPDDDVLELTDQGAGNFALLKFDAVNTHDIEKNIEKGLSLEALIAAFGSSTVRYCTEDGNPITYELTGEMGLRVKLADAFSTRVGDMVGIFVHDDVIEYTGADDFRNVGIRYGRIMEAELLKTDDKRLVFQPVAYSGSNVIVHEEATPTDGQIGRVILVK